MLSKLLIIGKYLISLIHFQPRFHNIMKLGKKAGPLIIQVEYFNLKGEALNEI